MIINRHTYLDDRTIGTLTLPDGREFDTLELPWRDNLPNFSCIKPGRYLFKRDLTGRHQWFKLLYVDGLTNIEMHEGTKPEHSKGGILVSKECLQTMLNWYDDVNYEFVMEIIE